MNACGLPNGERKLWAELEEQRITTDKILRIESNQEVDGKVIMERQYQACYYEIGM